MSDSIAADVLDALYDLAEATPALVTLVDAGTLVLYDGPPVGDISSDMIMTIGALPVQGDESETGEGLTWGSLGVSGGNADVDAVATIPCGIAYLNGDSGAMRTMRRAAIEAYAAYASAVRSGTLNLGPVMWCLVSNATIQQLQTEDGAECIVTWTVSVRTRI